MRARAAVPSLLLAGLLALPWAAFALPASGPAAEAGPSHADGLSCYDRMIAELGWDVPEGLDVRRDAVVPEVVPYEPPSDLHPCSGKIQPGASILFCTMNFIFQDQLGRWYFGTAGHCGGVGARYSVAGVGSNVATVVYSGFGGSPSIDFGLARIDPAFYGFIDPTMCHWGGPMGVTTFHGLGQTTHLYGYGNIYGSSSATRFRTGVVQSSSTITTTYIGFAQPGDSGAPVMARDGTALGVHVASSLSVGGIRVDPSQKFATRLDTAIAAAEAATGLDLRLVDGNTPFSLLGP